MLNALIIKALKVNTILLFSYLAISICKSCLTFTCEISNCGGAHLYHDIDNIQSWIINQIKPSLEKFINSDDFLKSTESGYDQLLKELKSNKKKIDKFIIDEKRKCENSRKKINELIENIYSNTLDEINQFGCEVKNKFDEKVNLLQSSRIEEGINKSNI